MHTFLDPNSRDNIFNCRLQRSRQTRCVHACSHSFHS